MKKYILHLYYKDSYVGYTTIMADSSEDAVDEFYKNSYNKQYTVTDCYRIGE